MIAHKAPGVIPSSRQSLCSVCVPVVTALGRWKQENPKFRVILDYKKGVQDQPEILRLQEIIVPALEATEPGRKECGAETQQVHRGPQNQRTPVSPVKTICASEKE